MIKKLLQVFFSPGYALGLGLGITGACKEALPANLRITGDDSPRVTSDGSYRVHS